MSIEDSQVKYKGARSRVGGARARVVPVQGRNGISLFKIMEATATIWILSCFSLRSLR
jgi:hypothetical protein